MRTSTIQRLKNIITYGISITHITNAHNNLLKVVPNSVNNPISWRNFWLTNLENTNQILNHKYIYKSRVCFLTAVTGILQFLVSKDTGALPSQNFNEW